MDLTGKLLHTLVHNTREHFEAEESMMEAAKYPASPTHRIKHKQLTKQVENHFVRYERVDINLSLCLLNFLSDCSPPTFKARTRCSGPG